MIVREGNFARVSGRLTMMEAATYLEEGRALVANGVSEFDLSGLEAADSAALSVLFGWVREAKARGSMLRFRNTPGNLHSLADVYGVAELLPSA